MGKGSNRRNENAQAVRDNWPLPERPRRRYVPPEETPAVTLEYPKLTQPASGSFVRHMREALDTSVTPD